MVATSTTAQYTPPASHSKKQKIQTQVVRGCEGQNASIKLIAPEDRIGKTSSSNPTFLIELSDLPSTPLIVSITQNGVAEANYYREFVPEQTGKIAIPTAGNLQAGEYVLTIGYFCQREPNRSPIYLRVAFEKVDLTDEQENLLSRSTKQEELLVEWGLDYDAIVQKYFLVNR